MTRKTLLVLLAALLVGGGYLFFNQQLLSPGLETYYSEDFAMSFEYDKDMRVFQQDEDEIYIKANYTNTEHGGVTMGMNIRRIEPKPSTKEELNSRLQFGGKSIASEERRNGYTLYAWGDGSQYYLVSNTGTFYVGDTLETWREIFEKEGVYQPYRLKFKAIISSIRFK